MGEPLSRTHVTNHGTYTTSGNAMFIDSTVDVIGDIEKCCANKTCCESSGDGKCAKWTWGIAGAVTGTLQAICAYNLMQGDHHQSLAAKSNILGACSLVINSTNLARSLYQLCRENPKGSKGCYIYSVAMSTSLVALSLVSFGVVDFSHHPSD